MEIILTKDVGNLGLAGQVLKVAPGYARNFLLPTGQALEATAGNLKALARKRSEFERRATEAKELALSLKNNYSTLVLTITRKAGDKGKLFGAVTASDIVNAADERGYTLDRKRLRIAEPIKTLGDFEVSIKLHPEVTGTFKVRVVSDAPKAEEPAKAEEKPTEDPRVDPIFGD
ncbi:MAG: 50S ribosomal protein L9 [Deltaproteobacteria bacterium]|jgi:large subunit ribosomal protein L9|nr:50S ribosomal protein L9 [Deltaproteobacteria bacterium]